MNKISTSLLKVSSILALILAVISFIVPFLLGGFVLIGLGALLGIIGIFGEKRVLGIVALILSIISLVISPTFWLFLSSSGKDTVQKEAGIQEINKENLKPMPSSEEQFLDDLQETEKHSPDKKKKYAFAIENLGDGKYNYYPATYQYSNPEKVKEAFSNKGLVYSSGAVNIKPIDLRKILEINAVEHSSNPQKMEEFLSVISSNVIKERDNSMRTIYKYSYTQEQAQVYKSEIQELQEFSGFSGVVLP